MEARGYKKTELKIRVEFQNNVHLLTLIYPPSKEFLNVFKENMFLKSNQAGFHEVVYYLLGIIEPDKLKQKIPTWPVANLRMEHSFRSEVLKFINELSSMYEEACLPKIATSQLISPGGVRFTKFMLMLSQFVLYVHVKRSGKFSKFLYPVKPTKSKIVTKEHLRKFNVYIGNISSVKSQLQSFSEMKEMAEKEASSILEKQKEAHEMCKNFEAKLEVLRKQALGNDVNEGDMFVRCVEILETLTNLRDRMYKCHELSNYLIGNEGEIAYKKGTNNDFEDEDENLDLVKLMENYHQAINRQQFEIQLSDAKYIVSQIKRFEELKRKFTTIINNLDQLQPELTKLANRIQEMSLNNLPKIGKELIPAMESTGNDCNSGMVADCLLPLSSTVIDNDTFTNK